MRAKGEVMSAIDELLEIDQDGQRYVAVSALMHPIVAMADGLSLTRFSRSERLYLSIDSAIGWIDKEIASAPSDRAVDLRKSREVLVAYRDAPEDVLTGGSFRFNKATQRMEPNNGS